MAEATYKIEDIIFEIFTYDITLYKETFKIQNSLKKLDVNNIIPSKYCKLMCNYFDFIVICESLYDFINNKYGGDDLKVIDLYESVLMIENSEYDKFVSSDKTDHIIKKYFNKLGKNVRKTYPYLDFNWYKNCVVDYEKLFYEKLLIFYNSLKEIASDCFSHKDNNNNDNNLYNCIIDICCFDIMEFCFHEDIIDCLKSYIKLIDINICIEILIRVRMFSWNRKDFYEELLLNLTKDKQPLKKLLYSEKKTFSKCIANLFNIKIYDMEDRGSIYGPIKVFANYISLNDYIELVRLLHVSSSSSKINDKGVTEFYQKISSLVNQIESSIAKDEPNDLKQIKSDNSKINITNKNLNLFNQPD